MDAPKVYNYHTKTFEYLGESFADTSPMEENKWLFPAFSTTIEPPNSAQNQAAIFDGAQNKWSIVPDFRGQTWYKDDGTEVIIDKFGNPEDQGLLQEKPTQPEQPVFYPDLSPRQFWQAALTLGVTEAGVVSALSDEKDPLYIKDIGEREAAIIVIQKTVEFTRSFWLLEEIAKQSGITEEQLNDLWLWAKTIE